MAASASLASSPPDGGRARAGPPGGPQAAGRAADPDRGTTTRDTQRSRVYRAEHVWAARLDAARLGAPLATVAGSRLLLPAERRFGSLEAAASYAGRVLTLPAVADALGQVAPPRLRLRRGARAAHWEPPGTIAVPVPARGEPWALRESVLLHELTHHVGHLTGRARLHGAPFPALLLVLVAAALGEQAAFALRVDYGQQLVRVGQL